MESKFNELPWHDAEILNVTIDRRNPGENDQIMIDIYWPNGQKGTLVFSDCYKLEANMNFGIMVPESILDASFTDESWELAQIRQKWAQIGVDLKQLKCFELKMNSTDSILRIYALKFCF